MGIPLRKYIDSRYVFQCVECSTHLSTPTDVVSRSFSGTLGQAFLFRKVLNVHFGTAESRKLLTGIHIVCDVFCKGCDSLLGWKYIYAEDPSQRYKIDMVVLEQTLFRLLHQTYVPVDPDCSSDLSYLNEDIESDDRSSGEEYNISM
ncbi:hypothetical protein MDAP_000974 [Mitosporidium daphniae]